MPGLFPPVRISDRLLVDGSLADNLPVWAARGLGADMVIAVSVDPFVDGAASRPGRLLVTLRNRLSDLPATESCPPEVLIQADTAGLPHWSAKGVPELIAAGRRAAETALPAITSMIAALPSG